MTVCYWLNSEQVSKLTGDDCLHVGILRRSRHTFYRDRKSGSATTNIEGTHLRLGKSPWGHGIVVDMC